MIFTAFGTTQHVGLTDNMWDSQTFGIANCGSNTHFVNGLRNCGEW